MKTRIFMLIITLALFSTGVMAKEYVQPVAGVIVIGDDITGGMAGIRYARDLSPHWDMEIEGVNSVVGGYSEDGKYSYSSYGVYSTYTHFLTDALYIAGKAGIDYNSTKIKWKDDNYSGNGSGFASGISVGVKTGIVNMRVDYMALERNVRYGAVAVFIPIN